MLYHCNSVALRENNLLELWRHILQCWCQIRSCAVASDCVSLFGARCCSTRLSCCYCNIPANKLWRETQINIESCNSLVMGTNHQCSRCSVVQSREPQQKLLYLCHWSTCDVSMYWYYRLDSERHFLSWSDCFTHRNTHTRNKKQIAYHGFWIRVQQGWKFESATWTNSRRKKKKKSVATWLGLMNNWLETCIKSYRYRPRASVNVHIIHQNGENVWSLWLRHGSSARRADLIVSETARPLGFSHKTLLIREVRGKWPDPIKLTGRLQ